jgi:hypothetical protein
VDVLGGCVRRNEPTDEFGFPPLQGEETEITKR